MLKKMILISLVLSAGMVSSALADLVSVPGLIPLCQLSYRFDSYGRGLEAGLYGRDLRPLLLDERCYQLGLKKAAQVASQDDCTDDFMSGRAQGFEASPYGAGSECYVIGYQAGLAALDVGAREADISVGRDCLDEYARGTKDARSLLAALAPMDAKLRNCYLTGYNDQVLAQ